jgi:hypothetical protein
MAKSVCRSIFVVVSGLMFVATASATLTAEKKQTDNGQCIYQTIDACFHEGDWWYEGTTIEGGFRYTVIDCGLTDGCKACGLTSLGKPVCVNILYNAACKCNIEHVPGTGPNIVACNSEGSCEVR